MDNKYKKEESYLDKTILLTRKVKNKIRYYTLTIFKNLFGEYILEKSFGSVANKKPTRNIVEIYPTFEESIIEYQKTISKKSKKGYVSLLPKRMGLFGHPTF